METVVPRPAPSGLYKISFWFIGQGCFFSLLRAVFIYHIASVRKKLDELVRLRTRQLKDSEAKFSKNLSLNLLGLVIYDTDWVL